MKKISMVIRAKLLDLLLKVGNAILEIPQSIRLILDMVIIFLFSYIFVSIIFPLLTCSFKIVISLGIWLCAVLVFVALINNPKDD